MMYLPLHKVADTPFHIQGAEYVSRHINTAVIYNLKVKKWDKIPVG